jgi:hypothetical protein
MISNLGTDEHYTETLKAKDKHLPVFQNFDQRTILALG